MHFRLHPFAHQRSCYESWHQDAGFEGGFGVRRPLRFLAYRLDLSEAQVAQLAQILNDLKTDRAQAAVDDRRTLSSLADAVEQETFDDAKARAGAALRVKSAETLAGSVVTALSRIHAILDPVQRGKVATMIRTGTLQL